VVKNNAKIIANTEYEEQSGSTHPKQKGQSSDLLDKLLFTFDNHSLTPFELAIAKGNIDAASQLLPYGPLDVPSAKAAVAKQAKAEKKNDDDDFYEGLDVGGKKMSWVSEHRALPKRMRPRTCLHIAAAYDQVKSIEYLLDEKTYKTWEKNAYADSKKPDTNDAVDFDLSAKDERGRNAIHYAVMNKKKNALKVLLEMDKKPKKGLKGTGHI
jgi:ankyrin repeat protein